MIKFDDKYSLTGKFLIASPMLDESGFFSRSVVYICSHTSEGAMGLIVNKRLENFSFADLTFQFPIERSRTISNVSLYSGGPLENVRGMVLHSTDYIKEGTVLVSPDVALSATNEIITDIATDQGPEYKLVTLGYSFWRPQQLEAEFLHNDWFVAEGDRELLFKTRDEDKWQQALNETGIDMRRFVGITGYA